MWIGTLTTRLSEATERFYLPQAEAWGFITITALRAEKFVRKMVHIHEHSTN